MSAVRELVFPPFRLDLLNERLWRGADEIPLRPKTFAVLRALAERSGRLVTKDELLATVWPGVHVSAAVPRIYVQELRELLDDDAETPRYIETVHSRGYRFLPATATDRTEPLGDRGGLEARPSTGGPSLVGRQAELGHLQAWLERALGGSRQVVFVTGEPGIGKTTLVEAFLDRVARDFRFWVAPGQCLDHHGPGEPYLPVLEALGRRCRESGGQRLVQMLQRYAPAWLAQMPWLIDDEARESVRHAVAGATREGMLRQIAEALEALTVETPLVLFLEDLHASDPSTLDLIAFLAQRREPARLLVLGTFRPPGGPAGAHPLRRLTSELQIHRRSEQLPLGFLVEDDVARYLDGRFPGCRLPAALPQTIHRRTEGNPLFMVSVVDYLVAAGLLVSEQNEWHLRGDSAEVASAVPETLRLVIERSFDGLSSEQRQVMEVASVAGVEVVTATVAAGLELPLERVEEVCLELAGAGQFLRPHGYEEWPDGTVAARYRFIHAIYQDVLYERLTASRRARLHRAIGARLELGHGEQAGEVAPSLALHFERGRDLERAVRYLGQAGEKAIRRHAHHEAIAHLSRALELLDALADGPERVRQEISLCIALGGQLIAAKGFSATEVERTFTRARDLCREPGQARQLFAALRGLLLFYAARPDVAMSRGLAEEIMALAQRSGDSGLLVEAHWTRGSMGLLSGDFRKAETDIEAAVALYDSSEHRAHVFVYGQDPGTSAAGFRAVIAWFVGYPDRARDLAAAAAALAAERSHPFSRTGALCLAGMVHQLRRDGVTTREHAQAIIALAEEGQFAYYLGWGKGLLGWALTQEGGVDEGIALISTGLGPFRTSGTGAGFFRPYFMALLAEAHRSLGRMDDARRVVDEALSVVERTGDRVYEAELWRLKGELCLTSNARSGADGGRTTASRSRPRPAAVATIDAAEAERCFRSAVHLARKQSARSLELRAATSLARLLAGRGKGAEARRGLAKIHDWFSEGADTADLREARTLLETL